MHVAGYGAYAVQIKTKYVIQRDRVRFVCSINNCAQVINCYYETWVLGPLFCELYALAGSLFGCGSIWTMTMIAFDRYNVIVKGLSAKPMTNSGALVRIFGIWFFSLIWTIAPLFGWNR